MLEPLNPEVRPACARQVMVCCRKTDESRLLLPVLQCDEQLLRLLHRTAVVMLAVQYQQRRFNIIHIFDRRMMPHRIDIIEIRLDLPVTEIIADIGYAPEADPVGYAALCHRCLEAVRMTDDPIRHEAAV